MAPQKVTCYLDESATDGGTPNAVVGGILMNDSGFMNFDDAWKRFLDKHGLRPAFHMKDFKRDGRFASLGKNQRRAIFNDAVALIQEYKILSVSSALTVKDYNEVVDPFMKHEKGMSIYGFCFLGCVAANVDSANSNGHDGPIHYTMDGGNPFKYHIEQSYDAVCHDPQWHLAIPLEFSNDEDVTALQAADLICWAARRRAVGGSFLGGFEPIKEVLDEASGHASQAVRREDLSAISASMVEWRDSLEADQN